MNQFLKFCVRLWACEFGGGGKGGGGSSTTTQELAPEQRELLGLVIPEARRISENTPELFPGSSIQGFDPLQTQAQGQAVTAAGGQVQQLADQGTQANNFLTSGAVLDPRLNPGLQGAIQAAIAPIQRQFTTSVLPGIRQEAITAGGFGGSRQGIAEGLASQGFLDSIGNAASNVVNPGFLAGLQAFTSGISNTQDLQDAALRPSTAVDAVGAQKQALAQGQLSEQAQRFLSEQILPFSVAQDIAALAFGIGGGSSTTNSNRNSDPLSTILGIGSIVAPFFCWIAREVYGVRDPRWIVFRNWLWDHAPQWVLRLYTRYGSATAEWLKGKPRVKRIIRNLMDTAIGA